MIHLFGLPLFENWTEVACSGLFAFIGHKTHKMHKHLEKLTSTDHHVMGNPSYQDPI